ncbi:MAG TPA: transglutaminase-like domain-containing protein, partial [Planctomycetaceae bacterium]|nr:transglutaminase-like domain-containing protein [Planctomycetaceae bacterium]
GDATDPVEKCRRMEKYVAETLKNKNFSTAMASAGEVARTLEGDCTEHAVLLAAMLRAEGIPSRVAVGLVYVASDPNFGGHMWTEACLDGEWHALDGTLGRGGTTAVHLKLGDSSLAEEGLSQSELFVPLVTILGKLQIEVVSVKE